MRTMSYQTSSKRSPPFWLQIGARKRTGLVRHCPQGLFSPFFTFLRAIYFSARLDFSSSPLSAPGSPRMVGGECDSSARYLSTENLPIKECSRSIERHITETLQSSFANCGLNPEAELLLARADKFET